MKHNQYLFYILFLAFGAQAQVILPPSGGNQKSIVTQYIGSIAHVTLEYNSPDVTAPNGQSREGQIWGTLVPYGLTDLGFGLRNPSPWRAGSNENTTIEFSHDMKIQGEKIEAGKYGLHLIAEEEGPWTLILSNNHTAWGSYFYDESEDALRVEATPEENEYQEWLTYEFIDRQSDYTVCALKWENLSLPFKIEVENVQDLYLTKMKQDLQNSTGFNWQAWNQAANYCLQNNTALEQGLEWVEYSIAGSFVGQPNFTNLSTKAALQASLGKMAASNETLMQAIEHPTSTSFQIHQVGRQLITQGNKEMAMKVFQINFDRFEGAWPTHVGMARGLSALGKYAEAKSHAEIALGQAPDQLNKDSLTSAIEKLTKKEDIN